MRRFHPAVAALLLAIGNISPVFAQSHGPASAPPAPKAAYHDAFRLDANASAAQVRIAAPEAQAVAKARAANGASRNKRMRIGINAEVPGSAVADAAALDWTAVAGGAAARWNVSSEGARALRVALGIARIPAGVELRFAGSANPATVYGPFTARDVALSGPVFWSPVLDGDSAIVEIFAPAGIAPGSLGITLQRASYLFVRPSDPDAITLAKVAGACQVDLICRSATDALMAQTARSVTRITFNDGTGTFLCTATLLNPSDGSFTPFLHTAGHCMESAASAPSTTTHWFYERTTCSGTVLNPANVQVSGGAQLLQLDIASDSALVRMNASPPAAAVYAGWDAATVTAFGSPATAIHHPDGDVKKVSLGTFASLGPAVENALPGNFLRINWNSLATGTTEHGSSGSGIFSGNATAGYRLRGGVWAGPSSCEAGPSELFDDYSRFDVQYPFIAQYLNPAAAPAFGSNVLANPGFESGSASWTQSSSSGLGIITNDPANARSGSNYAWLGGNNNLTDTLYQDVTVPAGVARLQYWYRIQTQETLGGEFDTMTIAVLNRTTGAVLRTLVSYSNLTPTGSWVQGPYLDLSPWAGQTVRLRFRATTDGSETTSFRIDDIAITAATMATFNNYTALWWNAAESGWGLNVNHQGDVAFATLFTYDSNGAPMWLVMSGGTRQGNSDTFTGDLFRTTGPAFNASPFTPIGAANLTRVGSMTLNFAGSNNATLAYSVNGVNVNKVIERQVYGAAAANCLSTTRSRADATNGQDLWWNPAESGWGINLTHQGNTIFATLFTYGSGSGNANAGLWLVMSAGTRQSDGSYQGELYRTSGPAFNAQPFPAPTVTRVGTMRIVFSNPETATLTYSVDGTNVTKAITRQVFSSPVPTCSG
jgi:lysyl endopeptidase